MPTREDFEITDSLPDNFLGEITDAEFTVDENYGVSDPQVKIVIDSPTFDQPQRKLYSCGSKLAWEIKNGGSEVVSSVDDSVKKFHANSRAAILVNAIIDAIGGGDRGKGIEWVLSNKGEAMTNVNFYLGLGQFVWKRKQLPTVDPNKTTEALLPVEWRGGNGKQQTTETESKSAAKAESKSSDEASEEDVATIVELCDGKTIKQLRRALAKNPQIKGKSALMKQLMDPNSSVLEGILGDQVKAGTLTLEEDEYTKA